MIAMVCIDDKGGTMFNHRRQSQDRILRQQLLDAAKGHILWVNTYSAKQFAPEEQSQLSVSEDFLSQAKAGDYCFVEGDSLAPYEQLLEKILLFKWNRVYPADTYFDIPLDEHGWHLAEQCDFTGSSHKKITKEVYQR